MARLASECSNFGLRRPSRLGPFRPDEQQSDRNERKTGQDRRKATPLRSGLDALDPTIDRPHEDSPPLSSRPES